eukprot:Transcript_23369.p3 GENE.Transcript_23369~~Transcript_23369.p3  ORF type:complete len:203 (+),score=91.85 Transcript_23369:90-698(+)
MRAFTLLLVVLSAQLGACFRVTATPAACRISAHPRCAVTLLAKKAAKGKETLVVLLEPVKGIGKKGEVVSVKPAYAQNVLLAKGLGKVASPDVLKEIEKADAEAAAAAAAAKQEAKDIAAKIESAFGDEGVFIEKKVGPSGDIFGSVTGADVADCIAERLGVTVDRKAVTVPSISSVGSVVASLALHKEVKANLKLTVVAAG